MMRALVLVNVNSRRGAEESGAALQVLERGGVRLVRVEPQGAEGIGAAIRDHRGQVDLVVLGGGDGTMNAAAAALLETQIPFAVLPLGTANDLARVLGIPPDPVAAARQILEGGRNRIDLGRANDRLFFNIATIGLSARLARAMDRQTKKRFGALAYPLTVARIGLGRPFHAHIRSDRGTLDLDTIQIAVGNGRYHGGGIVVHEAAAIDDGLLHLYALAPQGVGALLAKLPWLLRGRHAVTSGVETLTATSFEIHTAEKLAVNTDGEITTHTPVRFGVVPEAIEVCVPR
jgi:YegS/Rv2252/BmrU family lipid kinase